MDVFICQINDNKKIFNIGIGINILKKINKLNNNKHKLWMKFNIIFWHTDFDVSHSFMCVCATIHPIKFECMSGHWLDKSFIWLTYFLIFLDFRKSPHNKSIFSHLIDNWESMEIKSTLIHQNQMEIAKIYTHKKRAGLENPHKRHTFYGLRLFMH